MDKSIKFSGSFAQLYIGLMIFHHYIIIGNSKGNRKIKRMIWTLKDSIWCSLMIEPSSL